jgi:DNA-binding IclR family transcriptional regulator
MATSAPSARTSPRRTVSAARDAAERPESLVKSADRVLRIFDLIATEGPRTFREVPAALGLPASSTHNLLKTLVRREYLRLDLDDRRYAVDNEEYVVGCRCIAMPIRDANGSVVAAMPVSIPTPRYSEELAPRTHRALAAAVGELSTRLGYVSEGVG